MQDFWFIGLSFYILLILLFNFVKFRLPLSINPLFFVTLATGMYIAIPYFMDQIFQQEKIYTDFSLVSIFTIISLTGFLLGYIIPCRIKRNIKYTESDNKIEIKTTTILLFFIAGFITYLITLQTLGITLLSTIISIRSGTIEGRFNLWESFWRFPYTFSYGLINSSSLLLVFLFINDFISKKLKIFVVLIFFFGLLINFSTGTRMAVFAYILFPLICYFYKKKGIFSIGVLIKGMMFILLLFYLVSYLSTYRDVGLFVSSVKVEPMNLISYGLNQINDFQKAIDKFSKEDLLLGRTFFAVLVNPIPREFWPDKPVGIGAIMGEVDLLSRVGTSVSITIYGESYANFGAIGMFFVLFVFGILMRQFFYYYAKRPTMQRSVIYFYVLSFIPNEVRGGFLEVTMRYTIELIFLIIMLKLSIKTKEHKSHEIL